MGAAGVAVRARGACRRAEVTGKVWAAGGAAAGAEVGAARAEGRPRRAHQSRQLGAGPAACGARCRRLELAEGRRAESQSSAHFLRVPGRTTGDGSGGRRSSVGGARGGTGVRGAWC